MILQTVKKLALNSLSKTTKFTSLKVLKYLWIFRFSAMFCQAFLTTDRKCYWGNVFLKSLSAKQAKQSTPHVPLKSLRWSSVQTFASTTWNMTLCAFVKIQSDLRPSVSLCQLERAGTRLGPSLREMNFAILACNKALTSRNIKFPDWVFYVKGYTHLTGSRWILSQLFWIPVGNLAQRSLLLHSKSKALI